MRSLPSGSIIRLIEAVRRVSIDLAMFGLTEPETRKLESKFYCITSDGDTPLGMKQLIQLELSRSISDRQK